MYTLGLSFYYHDGSAALVEDGVLVAAGEEERFTRRKHDPGYPARAIDFCLEQAGITIDEVDYVVFYEKPFVKFERLLMTAFQTFPKSLKVFRESMLAWMQKKLWVASHIVEHLGIPKSKLVFADHHMSHAAASFFSSPFEESAVLTLDGAGEWTTATMGVGRGNKIQIRSEMRFPHSVGLLYSAFTAYCGFEVNEGEYKLMGMAPYGEPKYVDRIMTMIRIGEDGSLWQDMKYFAYHWSATSSFTPAFEEVMGRPARDPALEDKSLDPFYCDVAMSIQKVTEDIVKRMVDHLVETTGLTQVCLAGGVALNSVANGKLTKETKATEIYVHPAAGDDGGAAGAALWGYYHLLEQPRDPQKAWLQHAYLGTEYTDEQIEAFLGEHDIDYEKIEDDEEFFDRVTDDLIAGKVGGWYRGRFEWGPRALGSRSIIADASNPEMKEIVNAKIKFREAFRPFAPSVLEEDAREWFELQDDDPCWPARFMLYVVPVREDKREKIPAITHVDGSGRLQTVVKAFNPAYHRVIERFKEKTGIPVILNTSFNLKGEPIVETPAQAFNTFSRSEMDVLYLRNYVVTKEAKKIIDTTPFMLRHQGDRVAEMVS